MTVRDLFELQYMYDVSHDSINYNTTPVSIVMCETTEEIYYYEEDEWDVTPMDKEPFYIENF